MADERHERHDPLGDVINLLAAPLASSIRTFEQFRTGFDELLRTIENLNRTMENLNETAERVNRVLDDVEEPLRSMAAVPHRVDDLVGIMSEMSRRLGPLVSFAESAGGMFGVRIPGTGRTDEPPPIEPEPEQPAPARKKASPRKQAGKRP